MTGRPDSNSAPFDISWSAAPCSRCACPTTATSKRRAIWANRVAAPPKVASRIRVSRRDAGLFRRCLEPADRVLARSCCFPRAGARSGRSERRPARRRESPARRGRRCRRRAHRTSRQPSSHSRPRSPAAARPDRLTTTSLSMRPPHLDGGWYKSTPSAYAFIASGPSQGGGRWNSPAPPAALHFFLPSGPNWLR